MKHRWKKIAVSCLMVLALVATVGLGCGDDEEEGVTIVIGLITDVTGPAGVPCQPYGWAVEDMARYINENDPIPGVTLKVVTYDGRYDPARDIPGYDWVRGKGASIIWTPLPPTAATLQPFAEADKCPVVIQTASEASLTPPSWTFAWSPPPNRMIKPLLKHIGEQWTGDLPIEVASVGWADPYQNDVIAGMEEYCAIDDDFEFVGGFTTPFGTMTWSGEIGKTKDCDYISLPTTGLALPTFASQARDAGYGGEFMCTDAIGGSIQFLTDKTGWDAIDGMLTIWGTMFWVEDIEPIERAKWCLENYRPDEYENQIAEGSGYSCVYASGGLWFEIIRQAVEEVGAENFDGQAFYDVAVNFSTTDLDGYPEVGYADGTRWGLKHVAIYEWSAAVENLVRVGDWLPLLEE